MLFILFGVVTNVCAIGVIVNTTVGLIKGQKENGINTFFGIPYSVIDEEDLFGKSRYHPRFNETFDAYENNIICPQVIEKVAKGTMECLTLNIFVPQTEQKKLPVLVWFHGESFWNGNANDYRSPYLVKEGIIFVAVNYRIGVFGFICPNVTILPGNQGIRDQRAALKWVQTNIAAFNGDPDSVTIAGSGYGGGFVDLHLYATIERRLFHKAIIQSGSIFSSGFFVRPDPKQIIQIAKRLGKTVGKATRPLDVMRYIHAKHPKEIVKAAVYVGRDLGICGGVEPDDEFNNFVVSGPYTLEILDNVKDMKLLIGYNSMEMIDFYARNNTKDYYKNAGNIIYKALKDTFNLDEEILKSLSVIIERFYLHKKDYGPGSLVNISAAMSDFYVSNGVERTIDRLVAGGAVIYKYLFSYIGASEYYHIPGAGAPKGEELKFLLDWRKLIVGEEQKAIRTTMVKLWSNFIKFGNPTPKNEPVAWTPLHGISRPYLNIDKNISMKRETSQHVQSFWHLFWFIFQKDAKVY